MADTNNAVLCPIIAEEQIIISSENVDSLLLNSYERSVGTEVKVTCLSSTHALTGETDVLVCENGGQWSSEIPRCVDRRLLDNDGDIIETTTRALHSGTGTYSWEILPYIVALGILGLACLLLIILLSYALLGRNRPSSETGSGIFGGSRSSRETAESHTEFWVEMSGSRTFPCHELAQSRDSMVDIVRYTNLHTDWSGY